MPSSATKAGHVASAAASAHADVVHSNVALSKLTEGTGFYDVDPDVLHKAIELYMRQPAVLSWDEQRHAKERENVQPFMTGVLVIIHLICFKPNDQKLWLYVETGESVVAAIELARTAVAAASSGVASATASSSSVSDAMRVDEKKSWHIWLNENRIVTGHVHDRTQGRRADALWFVHDGPPPYMAAKNEFIVRYWQHVQEAGCVAVEYKVGNIDKRIAAIAIGELGHDHALRCEFVGAEMRPSFGVLVTGHNATILRHRRQVNKNDNLERHLDVADTEVLRFAPQAVDVAVQAAEKLSQVVQCAVNGPKIRVEGWEQMNCQVGDVCIEPRQLLAVTSRTVVFGAVVKKNGHKARKVAIKIANKVEDAANERRIMLELTSELGDQYSCAKLLADSANWHLGQMLFISPLGRSLVDECLCSKQKRQNVLAVLDRDILKALKFLHKRNNRVFYDLWPAQIILRHRGERMKAFLVDFESVQERNKARKGNAPIRRGPLEIQYREQTETCVSEEHDLYRYTVLRKYVNNGHSLQWENCEFDDEDYNAVVALYNDIEL